MLPFAITALGAAAVFLLAISLIPAKSPITRALEELSARGAGMRDPVSVRKFEAMFSKERRGRLERKLLEAGWYTVSPARLGMRIAGGAAAGLAAGLTLAIVAHMGLTVSIVLVSLLTIAGAYLPQSALDKAIEKRKKQVQRALPDFLDMVATTVQAGLSVNASLAYAIDAAPGALGEEIKSSLSEIRLGRARSDALKAAADRLQHQQFSTTVTAIVQAERLGTNISRVLGELAEDVRNHRIMLVEEHAAKLPVKMIFPLASFLLPALFVVIFGALAANYFSTH
ncbi:MAG TPA: type II secretion system F family protein [Candidatus Baltobacteraceae bacterium]|nr:type II secretion system F family protein [Candidatus Baltobacteraceae bacterium]